ncbi:MAG: DUF3592 domain-containing protein [Bacteroidota bacterium]
MNYVTFAFSVIMSIGAFWFSIKFIRLYLKVRKWNKVNATVTLKELFLHPKYSTSRSPYGLKVDYSYVVNNETYLGTKVYLIELAGGQANHMKSVAENKLNEIKQTTPVYVNPIDPTQAVMYCEGVGLYIFVFCMGIVALLMGLSEIF